MKKCGLANSVYQSNINYKNRREHLNEKSVCKNIISVNVYSSFVLVQ